MATIIMPLTRDLRFFKLSEFKRPELVDEEAAEMLDEVRAQFGSPIIITDDARVATDQPDGFSPTSLHYAGKAFDIRIRDWDSTQLWKFVVAVINVANWVANRKASMKGVELEIVWSEKDKHAHIAFGTGQANEFLVRGD